MSVFSGNKETKTKKSEKKKKDQNIKKAQKCITNMLTAIWPFTSAFICADEDRGNTNEPEHADYDNCKKSYNFFNSHQVGDGTYD